MNKFFTNNYIIFLFFIFIVFFHTLSNEIITWDEFTYILAGQSVVDGYLPYEKVWEMKPPMVYLMYSIPIYLFPDSLISIRIFGFVLLLIISLELNTILNYLKVKNLKLISILFFLSLMTYFFWLYPTTEHLCLPFLLMFVLFSLKLDKWSDYLFSGVFISLTILTRSNMILLGFLFPFFYFFNFYKLIGAKKSLSYISIYILGGLIPLIIILLTFFIDKKINLLLVSNIDVLLVYSNEFTIIDSIFKYLKTFFKMIYFYPFLYFPLLILILISLFNNSFKAFKTYESRLIIFTLFSVLLSILVSKQGFSHHLIQLLPILIVFMVLSFQNINKNFFNRLIKFLFLTPIIYVLIISTLDSWVFFRNLENLSSQYKVYNYSKELSKSMKPNDRILALDYHIIYWYLKEIHTPTSPIAHTPAFIRKTSKLRIKPLEEIGFVEKNHIDNMLSSKPEIIICSSRICEDGTENIDNKKIKEILIDYSEIKRINDVMLWEFTKKSSLIIYRKK
tara:strand:+ start:278 stop:1795 length:1518 start_codon:yes stop_codon:yes gene_type:complete